MSAAIFTGNLCDARHISCFFSKDHSVFFFARRSSIFETQRKACSAPLHFFRLFRDLGQLLFDAVLLLISYRNDGTDAAQPLGARGNRSIGRRALLFILRPTPRINPFKMGRKLRSVTDNRI